MKIQIEEYRPFSKINLKRIKDPKCYLQNYEVTWRKHIGRHLYIDLGNDLCDIISETQTTKAEKEKCD